MYISFSDLNITKIQILRYSQKNVFLKHNNPSNLLKKSGIEIKKEPINKLKKIITRNISEYDIVKFIFIKYNSNTDRVKYDVEYMKLYFLIVLK